MPYFSSITRSGVKATLESGSHIVTIDGVPMPLPDAAGAGIDLVAADVGADVWAVCIGQSDDCGYLLKLNDRSITKLGDGKVRGRYAVWVTETGDVSWVPNSDPYAVEHMNGTRSESRDTHHPLSPNELLIEDWGTVRVVQTFRSDHWTVGEDVSAPTGHTRIYARSGAGEPLFVWSGFAPLPAHLCAHPDGSCTVAIQIPRGESVPVFVHSSEFEDVAPDPQPEPEPEPMPPPNRIDIVRAIAAQFPHLLTTNTHETIAEFYWRTVWALHQADPKFGFLTKSAGENHVVIEGQFYAVDSCAYQGWDGVVDFINSATGGPNEPASPSWGEDVKRPENVWAQPFPFVGSGEEPLPEPPDPPSDRHKYQGGGNDMGVCDQCGQVRSAVIHVIPESSKPHNYDGGEQDTGLCDICQLPKDDGIHRGIAPPPPPPPPPPGNDPDEPSERELIDAIRANTRAVEVHSQAVARLESAVNGLIDKPVNVRFPKYRTNVRVLGTVTSEPVDEQE